MKRRISLKTLLWAATFGLALATIAGFLGALAWWLDLFAHFRVHYAVAAALLAVASLAVRRRGPAAAAAVLLGINVASIAPYLSAIPAAAGPPTLKIVFFNLWENNPDTGPALDFLRRENADVVVLGEVEPHWAKALDGLADLYPHRLDRLDCRENGHCEMTMLSKKPWIKAAAGRHDQSKPPIVWARFLKDGRDFTVLGTHLSWSLGPRSARMQRRQVESLAALARGFDGPLVVAGDFNFTPWSARFRRFEEASGLRRAGGGIVPTWPARIMPLGIPIDHVFAGPGFASATARSGPDVGSDHLPVIAELR